MLRRLLAISCILWVAIPAVAGTWTPNNFLYKPSTGARGEAEKKTFENGLDQVDQRLGKEIWVGDPGRGTTLQSAVTAVGGNQTLLRIPAGTWNVATNFTIPANITLKPARGAILNIYSGITLTISGELEAGNHQIFTYTGTGRAVLAGNSKVKAAWFGDKNNTSISRAIAALSAPKGSVELEGGTYAIAASFDPGSTVITIEGAGMDVTTLSSSGVATSIIDSPYLYGFHLRNLTLQGNATSLVLFKVGGFYDCTIENVKFIGAKKLLEAIATVTYPVISYNKFVNCIFYGSSAATDTIIDIQSGSGIATFIRFSQCRISNSSTTQYAIGLNGASAIFSQDEITGTLGFKLVGGRAYVGNGCHVELNTKPYHSIDSASALKVVDNDYIAYHLGGTNTTRFIGQDDGFGLNNIFIESFNGIPKKPYISRNILRNYNFYSTAAVAIDGWTYNGTLAIDPTKYPNNNVSDSRILDFTALHDKASNYLESSTIDLKTICPAVFNTGYFYLSFKILPPEGVSTNSARIYVRDNITNSWLGQTISDQLTAGQWNTIRVEFRPAEEFKAAATTIKVQIYPTYSQAPAGDELWKVTEVSLHYVTYEPFYGEIVIPDYLSGPPIDGTFPQGKVFYNPTPTSGSYTGWECIAAGTPGTWRGFGWIPKKDTTGNRPTLGANDIGATHFDTTLDADGLPVFWNGSKWIKADGTDG